MIKMALLKIVATSYFTRLDQGSKNAEQNGFKHQSYFGAYKILCGMSY